ncbi:Retrovirus-related Pol polyprotein from transposon TNT 1-94 [Vitis vinifera]|uniref:Retrovirus-related Pol polyprotein from transposon TNT 1-94 n=1 Tax=Vitis vinifera TaxID=29760 RepID=A0A438HFL3_VITVI|nr:Retrovirus-related Pol polyprotein from transposon TNT 1-94 [Vitis vinifera]
MAQTLRIGGCRLKIISMGGNCICLFWEKPESMKAEEWALLDRQVLGVIRLTLSRSVAHNVVKEKTTADLMKALSEIDFDDEIRALIVLASLPNSWEAMRMAVSNSTGKEKLKYNDIRDLILAEEIRRRDAGETSGSGSALNLETRGQQVQCWNVGKQVTLEGNAKSPKKKNEDDSANAVTEENYVGDFGKVYLADGSALDVVGLGDVRISLPNGSVWLLEKVRHIPDLRRNLISVGQLDDEGHAILFVGGTWKVTKGARVLARGKKTGTLYMTSCPRDTIAVADASTDTSLWHRRLGHMSEKGMKMLLSKGKLPELKTPKAEKLELVHTDLWGPSPVASLGGSRYYITFIDDSSRKVWVYFLKNKSDVFETFKKWKAMVETETGLKVKCLRSDNGGEYIDGGFSEYCAAQGIRMEKTIPGTPQQNGVAERMNRTLNERARSMRLHAGLPKTFWADAVSTAAYLINRGPSVPMEFRLPEEVWSGKEVKFSHLKVFGCVSYVHIDSDARSKLDAKSKICFFIGYGDEKFGYRSTVVSDVTEIDQKKSEFVNLDELTESTVQKGGEEDKENVNSQPECYDEALQDENSSKWELAMKDEMDSLLGNQTWELTELPVGKKALHNKWVYRIKNEHDGSKRYKARLVVKGFQQKEGIDYTEIFSPVVKMSTIRLVLGMVAAENLHLEQLDVKTAFLHGDLEEDLYMIQPEGFIVQGQENLVCKLRKSLYGLKQAPRQWYKKFDILCIELGSRDVKLITVAMLRSDIEKINNLKKQLSKQFAMKDLGAAKQILGMRIIRDKANGTLKLSQSEYVKKVLSRRRKGPYEQGALCLSYWQLDVCYGVYKARHCTCSGSCASLKLQGYVDADFAGDIDSRKKAEYVAATEAGKEMIWLHGFLDELGKKQEMGILHSDNKLVILEKICGSKNPADMLTKGVTIEKLKLVQLQLVF